MKKTYIVTAGCYSEYHISKVFDNREAAEEYARQCNFNIHDYWEHDASVEEYEVLSNYDLPKEEPRILVNLRRLDNGSFEEFIEYMTDSFVKEDEAPDFSDVGIQSMVIQVRSGESVEDFEKRARKVIIDSWYAWKYRERQIN